MGQVGWLLCELNQPSTAVPASITIKGHASCTMVERCQASGLGQVVPSIQCRETKKGSKSFTVWNDDYTLQIFL